ncbi:MAG: cadherin-like domain-containing protein, partial [Rhodospirillales bacterium]
MRPKDGAGSAVDRSAPAAGDTSLANVHAGTRGGAFGDRLSDGAATAPGGAEAGREAQDSSAGAPDSAATAADRAEAPLPPGTDAATEPSPAAFDRPAGGGGGGQAESVVAAPAFAAAAPPAAADDSDPPAVAAAMQGRPSPEAQAPGVADASAPAAPPVRDDAQTAASEASAGEPESAALPAPPATTQPASPPAAPGAPQEPETVIAPVAPPVSATAEPPAAAAGTPGDNHVPVAMADAVTTVENRMLVIEGADLLANDLDLDGDTLAIAAFNQPAHGTLAADAAGRLTYVPDPDFVGNDTFSYTVTDSAGASATATVTIAVAADNSAPVAVADVVTASE